MDNPVRAATVDLEMSYGVFLVGDPSDLEVDPGTIPSRSFLAVSRDGIVVVRTGIHSGYVELNVRLYDSAPSSNLALNDWDESIELEVGTSSGKLVAQGIMEEAPEALPNLAIKGPGEYRLNIHAKNRGMAVDKVSELPVESYLISIWPS